MSEFTTWIGRTKVRNAFLNCWPAEALAAALELKSVPPHDDLPPLWHWLYFLDAVPRSGIGHDGHVQRGGFLPPVPNLRRMFTGARTTTYRALRLGLPAVLRETIKDIQKKSGRSGDMYLVTVTFSYYQNGILCIAEERDLAFLSPNPDDAELKPVAEILEPIDDSAWAMDLTTDPVLLFRFSALTFNSHRIHYDLEYAAAKEGYPRLVVHAPLTAIMLAELARLNTGRRLASFSFKALTALFVGQTVRCRGNPSDNDSVVLIAYTPDAKPAVKATAILG